MPYTQSAYRKYNITETAVAKVYNDQGQVSALCLFDLTAAFDSVDHELLLLRLERQFGLRGAVVQCSDSNLICQTAICVIPFTASVFGRLLKIFFFSEN